MRSSSEVQLSWGDQLEGTLPLGLVDWDRGMIGSAGLFVGCFTCWAYFRYRDKGFQGHTLLALTVIWTAILSGTAALICSVLFLLVSVQCKTGEGSGLDLTDPHRLTL